MKRITNLGGLSRIVEGDANEVTDDEVLVIKDPVSGKIADIQKRVNGKMESILVKTEQPAPSKASFSFLDEMMKANKTE